MVRLTKAYSKALVPSYEKDYQVLVDAVKVFQDVLKIKTTTDVSLKKKNDMFAPVCGVTFLNNATNKIACQVYVHKYSTTLGTLILIAHELVHAWQIDNCKPNKSLWEAEAEELSLAMVTQLHIKRFPDKPESMLRSEVRMARGWVH